MSDAGFYTRTASGQTVCRLCHGAGDFHAPECAVLRLRLQLREITGALGGYVLTVRETVDVIDAVLRGADDQNGSLTP